MMLKALIVEQLEADGTLRTLKMQSEDNQRIVVAFSHEYEDPKQGPFHFLEEDDERRFVEGFAQCRARRLSARNFSKNDKVFHVNSLSWAGIPTDRAALSYYALSLPEFAIPQCISITDPHKPDREYRRIVRRDDDRHRYVIYLECTSSLGRFDFELSCDFSIDAHGFSQSEYRDSRSSVGNTGQDDWRFLVAENEAEKIKQFFEEVVSVKSNPWVSGSFYLVAFLCVVSLLLAVAHVVSIVLFPLVVIGGIVAIGIVGALQLRNDSKLSQKSFLELMALSYRQLPFIGTGTKRD